eukprot:948296-Lingulodinium_polyedra.AAC.1
MGGLAPRIHFCAPRISRHASTWSGMRSTTRSASPCTVNLPGVRSSQPLAAASMAGIASAREKITTASRQWSGPHTSGRSSLPRAEAIPAMLAAASGCKERSPWRFT